MAAPRDATAEGIECPVISTACTPLAFFYSNIATTVALSRVSNAVIQGLKINKGMILDRGGRSGESVL